jgi:hypothetical protein
MLVIECAINSQGVYIKSIENYCQYVGFIISDLNKHKKLDFEKQRRFS